MMNIMHVEHLEFIIGRVRDEKILGDTEFMGTGGFRASLEIFTVHPHEGYTSKCVKYNL